MLCPHVERQTNSRHLVGFEGIVEDHLLGNEVARESERLIVLVVGSLLHLTIEHHILAHVANDHVGFVSAVACRQIDESILGNALEGTLATTDLEARNRGSSEVDELQKGEGDKGLIGNVVYAGVGSNNGAHFVVIHHGVIREYHDFAISSTVTIRVLHHVGSNTDTTHTNGHRRLLTSTIAHRLSALYGAVAVDEHIGSFGTSIRDGEGLEFYGSSEYERITRTYLYVQHASRTRPCIDVDFTIASRHHEGKASEVFGKLRCTWSIAIYHALHIVLNHRRTQNHAVVIWIDAVVISFIKGVEHIVHYRIAIIGIRIVFTHIHHILLASLIGNRLYWCSNKGLLTI